MHQKKRPAEASRLFLFLLARSERRLPTRCSALLTRRCSDCFDLFFLWFLGLSIAFLFAFSDPFSLGCPPSSHFAHCNSIAFRPRARRSRNPQPLLPPRDCNQRS